MYYLCLVSSDWSTLSVYSYSSELVHDIFESDDDDKFEDEDDSNGKHKQTNKQHFNC